MTDPDLTTEVVGYRQWYVTPELELRAAGFSTGGSWAKGTNTAVCKRQKEIAGPDPYVYDYKPDPCGDSPGEECDCGFYALHDPSDHWYGKSTGLMSLWSTSHTDPLLSGIIVAWGKVQVHHQGFRAEHARIAALALPKTKRDQAVARAVASAYGVPCVPSEELPRIAAEFGGTVPIEYRPAKQPKRKDDLYMMLGGGYARGGGLYFPPSAFSTLTWTSTHTTALPAPTPPRVSKAARTRMEFIESIKKGSNRQGPPKPKRAPKKLG